jgi:hypothetical protein
MSSRESLRERRIFATMTLRIGMLRNKPNSSKQILRSPNLLGIVMLISCAYTPLARAQTSWEVTPYNVQVTVAFDSAPELTNHLQQTLMQSVARRSLAIVGPAWNLVVNPARDSNAHAMLYRLDQLSANAIEGLFPEAMERDKLLLVTVARSSLDFLIRVREFDCRTRSWGRDQQRSTPQARQIQALAIDALLDAFSPLAQIGEPYEEAEGEGKYFVIRLRAGALALDANSPVSAVPGTIFQPILRTNDRLGKPRPGGIRPVQWTFLVAEQRNAGRLTLREVALQTGLVTAKEFDSTFQRVASSSQGNATRGPVNNEQVAQALVEDELLTVEQSQRILQPQFKHRLIGKLYTGIRNPISGRSSRRTERLALAISTPSGPTRFLLRSREDNKRILVGYDVYSRTPSGDTSEKSEFLGSSNFRGELEIHPGAHPLRILYIKNGRELLARLPMVPGLEAEITASLIDDDLRLEAEGFVMGIQQNLVDMVIQRKILETRIKKRIVKQKFDEAEELLDDLRALRLPTHYSLELDRERQRLTRNDSRAQKKISLLFSGTQTILREYLDARAVETLAKELAAARATNITAATSVDNSGAAPTGN